MFEKSTISLKEQNKWKEASISADQTSYEFICYEGAEFLTLLEGKGCLRSCELNGSEITFIKFSVELGDASLKETEKQLFKEVYFIPSPTDLLNVRKFTVQKRGGKGLVDGIPMSARSLSRRFPSLHYGIEGYVRYVANSQTIPLKSIPIACAISYDINGSPFYKVVKNYYIEK